MQDLKFGDPLDAPPVFLPLVARGLRIVYIGLFAELLAVLWGAAGVAALRDDESFKLVIIGIEILAVIGGILRLAGASYCLATPSGTSARRAIIISVSLASGAMLLAFAKGVGALSQNLESLPGILQGAAELNFLFFLGELAQFAGRKDLARRVRPILVGCCFLLADLVLLVIVPDGSRLPTLILTITLAVGGLTLLVMYTNLIAATRKAILGGGLADRISTD